MNIAASLACIVALTCIAVGCKAETAVSYELDYGQLIILDAEALAETGIGKAYVSLLPALSKYVSTPTKVEELANDDAPSYSVRSGLQTFAIYSPSLNDSGAQSWARATYALFSIVNAQLADSDHRFYAINGGHDLGGMFLTPQQVEEAKKSLPHRSDWPYIPTLEHPYYGQFH